ncbi:MAG: type II toxin-antitoxin system RelE/ParE family toxin [Candidatus Diapherotrites archaeon]
MIPIYKSFYDEDWPKYFSKLDNTLKERVVKKISKIIEFPKKRHLGKKAKFFVDEIGQHRIIYRVFDETNEIRFYFVGSHKEYEKWFKQFF